MINISHKKLIGLSAILMLSLLWGSNFPIAKIGIMEIGAIEFRLASSIIYIVPIFIICLIKEDFRLLCLPDFLKLSFISIFNVAAVPTLNNLSLAYIKASNAAVLIYTMPAWTTLLSWIITKNFSVNGILSICFCVLGVIFLSNINSGLGTGEVIILISAMLWSVGTLLQARIQPKVSLLLGTTVQIVVGTVIVLCYYCYYSFGTLKNIDFTSIAISPEVLLSLLFTSLFGGSLAYFIWFFLIKNYGPIFASYSVLLSPVVSVLISHIVLGEDVTILMMIGLSCMLVSVIFSRKEKENPV